MRTLVFFVFVLAPMLSFAQSSGSNRAQTWDFSIGAIYQDSMSAGGNGGPETPTPDTSSLSVKSELGFGANFTYNFNEHFALGVDLDYIKPDYTLILVSEDPADEDIRINHTLSQFNGRIKGTYNFTAGPLTPYVDFGYGWTNIDSNVADGPPTTGCWWHPWWGYICQNFFSTFSSTETSGGGAVGIRYELRNSSFFKLSYNRWELDNGGNSDDFALESARLEYGWSF